MTEKDLYSIKICKVDKALEKTIKENWDRIAKPLDGLGDFENVISRIGAIGHSEKIDIKKRAVVMLCSDNGIIEEGVSQSKSLVTAQVARGMGMGLSSVCTMAKVTGTQIFPVDIGIKDEANIEGVLDKKIAPGTKNFLKEPAMTTEQALEAIETGINIVKELKENNFKLIATGEMGIGNTTTSSAVAAALLKIKPEEITGRGAGLSDAGLNKKIAVIAEGIEKYDLYNASPLKTLSSVGGFDIAGLTGIFIGGAVYEVPIVIDGLISATAALLAERILPGCKDFFIPSHSGREKGIVKILEALELSPLINGNLALGEGTGAVMLFPLLDTALSIYENAYKFDDTNIDQYERL